MWQALHVAAAPREAQPGSFHVLTAAHGLQIESGSDDWA